MPEGAVLHLAREVFRQGAEAMRARVAAQLELNGQHEMAVLVLRMSPPKFELPEVMVLGNPPEAETVETR